MHRPPCRDVQGPPCARPIPPLELVGTQLDQVRSLIVAELAPESLPDPVRPLVDHALAGTGKMIRPGLVLLSGLGCGRLSAQHLRAAVVMEMIHQATLHHDDVLDVADTRRGRPATRRVWGNAAAVLLGDLVLSRVLRRCVDLRRDVARVVADMAYRVCQGELRQTLTRGDRQVTESEYLEVIEDKSASFFAACCRVGAILAGASEEQVHAMGLYGLNVGMAFQITDDLLDVVASPEEVGKPAGRDAGTGTMTLAVIHLLRVLDKADRDDLTGRLEHGEDLTDWLQGAATKLGSLDYVRSRGKWYVRRALRHLKPIVVKDAKRALADLARYSACRKA